MIFPVFDFLDFGKSADPAPGGVTNAGTIHYEH